MIIMSCTLLRKVWTYHNYTTQNLKLCTKPIHFALYRNHRHYYIFTDMPCFYNLAQTAMQLQQAWS